MEAALADLGAQLEDVDVEVLDQGRSGFLGVGASEARVRVRVRDASGAESDEEPSTTGSEFAESEPVRVDAVEAPGPEEEWLEDQADLVADFLDDLFDVMDLGAEVEPVYQEGTMYVDVWASEGEESVALLIGRHGQALDALQELVRGVVHRRTGERCQVVVDVEDYRKRRRAQLVSRAREVARRVQKSGRPESLDPMNAFERKIVHDAVAAVSGVASGSEGEDPDRRVVIRRA
ncbi:MAG: RNA-binding cell elongation regulator Jag/EloR [Actinomycetota bacterium]